MPDLPELHHKRTVLILFAAVVLAVVVNLVTR